MGRKDVFQENSKYDKDKYQLEKGGQHTSKYMWTYVLTSDQEYNAALK